MIKRLEIFIYEFAQLSTFDFRETFMKIIKIIIDIYKVY